MGVAPVLENEKDEEETFAGIVLLQTQAKGLNLAKEQQKVKLSRDGETTLMKRQIEAMTLAEGRGTRCPGGLPCLREGRPPGHPKTPRINGSHGGGIARTDLLVVSPRLKTLLRLSFCLL